MAKKRTRKIIVFGVSNPTVVSCPADEFSTGVVEAEITNPNPATHTLQFAKLWKVESSGLLFISTMSQVGTSDIYQGTFMKMNLDPPSSGTTWTATFRVTAEWQISSQLLQSADCSANCNFS